MVLNKNLQVCYLHGESLRKTANAGTAGAGDQHSEHECGISRPDVQELQV